MAGGQAGQRKVLEDARADVLHQNELSEAKYVEWAKQSGLDVAAGGRTRSRREVAALIAKDNSYAQSWARTGQPSFFIQRPVRLRGHAVRHLQGSDRRADRKADELLKKGVKQEALYQALVDENVKAPAARCWSGAGPGAGRGVEVRGASGQCAGKRPQERAGHHRGVVGFQCPFCQRAQTDVAARS